MDAMKIRHPLAYKLGGLLGSAAIAAWMRTLDYRVAYYDPAVDPARPECRGQKVYVFWHEYLLFPLALRGHCNLAMLLSQHRDAEWVSQIARRMGFEFVRGSTRRGGVAALRTLLRKCRDMNLAITPDGPRGPRRRLAAGAVYVGSRLGLPLVCLGLGYDRPWRLRSWDRFAIPRPFSRARSVVGPPLHVPPHLDRRGLEAYRQMVESVLQRVTAEAEDWARSGKRLPCEWPLRRQIAWNRTAWSFRDRAA
jgi:lysophospholipid acyltransferase (LPLAT)-like uncharacterized protein